ncbi:hypothetical protein BT63DRAFT_317780 [Microthyrium microscopicum]|uniref:Chitin-binding type-1 domain-containing protein n=1 Tax=Microthyrium microscopicum TaxID=703497 RepID=A0A6A6U648_9PEZI|nr:hypothetical protein BT63DRAFT_317780 [Microthyrium microscopicum]
MKYIQLSALFAGAALAVVSPDMSCGGTNKYTCPSTAPCCSEWGWCGSTADFCGVGCVVAYGTCTDPTPHPAPSGTTVSTNEKCGVISGVTYVCPYSMCCSSFGNCGTGADYCGTGCQTGFSQGFCTAQAQSSSSVKPASSSSVKPASSSSVKPSSSSVKPSSSSVKPSSSSIKPSSSSSVKPSSSSSSAKVSSSSSVKPSSSSSSVKALSTSSVKSSSSVVASSSTSSAKASSSSVGTSTKSVSSSSSFAASLSSSLSSSASAAASSSSVIASSTDSSSSIVSSTDSSSSVVSSTDLSSSVIASSTDSLSSVVASSTDSSSSVIASSTDLSSSVVASSTDSSSSVVASSTDSSSSVAASSTDSSSSVVISSTDSSSSVSASFTDSSSSVVASSTDSSSSVPASSTLSSSVTASSSDSLSVASTTSSSTATSTDSSSSVVSSTTSSLSSSVSSSLSSSASSSKSSSASSSATSSKSSSVSSSASSSSSSATASATAGAKTVGQTILIFADTADNTFHGYSGLKGYGIPYETYVVGSGFALPALNTTATSGKYAGIVLVNVPALTAAQLTTLYNYQIQFGVRMTRLNEEPATQFGTAYAKSGTGCCGATTEQQIYFTNTAAFSTAGLKIGTTAGASTLGLYHYPATITNATLATAIASFATATGFTSVTVAGVINNFGNRQQMVFFIEWASDWSATSNYLQHAWIHWMTRGMYVGFRRVLFNTQVDDMHLSTTIYQKTTVVRLVPDDLNAIVTWQKGLQGRLSPGSNYTLEIAHNGNGDIDAATIKYPNGQCSPNTAIYYDDFAVAPIEFQKPLGTGKSYWPSTPATFGWSLACLLADPVANWFNNPTNRDQFMHLSHTFTHENLNNATYSDVNKEITFNIAWLNQIGIAQAQHFSANGLVPPAITGLHNGDSIKALMDNGIRFVVGDNTRPLLQNPTNDYWPLISTVAANGYAGLVIMPRWSTTIFYDCNTQACTTSEWIATSGGSGNFAALLVDAKNEHTRHVFQLHQDPMMFHQANLQNAGQPAYTVGTQSVNSIMQIWVETVLQEVTRLTNWPIITIKHDDTAQYFLNRMARDQCNYNLAYQYSTDNKNIIGATLTSTGNTCSAPIPVTFPVAATASVPTTSEQIGGDPLTLWVQMTGQPVTFTLSTPVAI